MMHGIVNTISAAVFNPHAVQTETLPVIYGFNNGRAFGDNWVGVLMAEDGTFLGNHVCSGEGWMLNDLGILEGSRPDRHKHFQEHYPNGYRMEFVGYDAVPKHTKLQAAFKLNDTQHAAETEEEPAK